VGPADYVTPIPSGLPSADAAPMLCAGVTMYAALRKSDTVGGDWIAISGAGGGLGHIGVQIASKGLGLRVIGIDHGSKEQLVKKSGAEHFIDITKFDSSSIVKEVQALTDGLGCHAVIVCTANNKAYEQSLALLRFGGTVVCVGVPEGVSVPIGSAKPAHLISSQLNITAVSVGNRKDAKAVLDMAARGVLKTKYTVESLDNLTDVCGSYPFQ
jgi:propanol-preferring alcohol dehydrogenase